MRGDGKTTRQLQSARKGAIFLVRDRQMQQYTEMLAQKHNRPDIQVKTLYWLEREAFRGLWFSDIILDHSINLSPRHFALAQVAYTRINHEEQPNG